MSSNFTPGPWEVRKTFYGETYIEGKDGDFVCAFPECSPNKKDVVMIAAAPEMAALLKAAYHELTCVTYVLPRGNTHDHAESLRLKIAALMCRVFKGEESAE